MKFTQKSIKSVIDEVRSLTFKAEVATTEEQEIELISSAKAMLKSLEIIGAMPTVGENENLLSLYDAAIRRIQSVISTRGLYDYFIEINDQKTIYERTSDAEAIKEFITEVRKQPCIFETARLYRGNETIAVAEFMKGYPVNDDVLKIGDNYHLVLLVNFSLVSKDEYILAVREMLNSAKQSPNGEHDVRMRYMVQPLVGEDIVNEIYEFYKGQGFNYYTMQLYFNASSLSRHVTSFADAILKAEGIIKDINGVHTSVALYYKHVLVAVANYYTATKESTQEKSEFLVTGEECISRFYLTEQCPCLYEDFILKINDYLDEVYDYDISDSRAFTPCRRAKALVYYAAQKIRNEEQESNIAKVMAEINRTMEDIERGVKYGQN